MAFFKRQPQGKSYKLGAADIKELHPFHVPCYATDKITVNGEPAGWMYRDMDETTSGWTFMSGTENQGYMDDPNNSAIYDLNTIASYDTHVIPFLGAPRGSAFERKTPGAEFTPITDWVTPRNKAAQRPLALCP